MVEATEKMQGFDGLAIYKHVANFDVAQIYEALTETTNKSSIIAQNCYLDNGLRYGVRRLDAWRSGGFEARCSGAAGKFKAGTA